MAGSIASLGGNSRHRKHSIGRTDLQVVRTGWDLTKVHLSFAAYLASRYGPPLWVTEHKEQLRRLSLVAGQMNRGADTTESFAAGRSEFLAVLVDVDFHHFASRARPTQANVVLAGRGRNLKHARRDHLRIARILDLDAIKYPPLQKWHLVAVLRFLIGVKKNVNSRDRY